MLKSLYNLYTNIDSMHIKTNPIKIWYEVPLKKSKQFWKNAENIADEKAENGWLIFIYL